MKTTRQLLSFTVILVVVVPALDARQEGRPQADSVPMFIITQPHAHLQHDQELAELGSELLTVTSQQAVLEDSVRALRIRLFDQATKHEQHIDDLEDTVRMRGSIVTSLSGLLADTTLAFIALQQSAARTQLELRQEVVGLGGTVDTLNQSLQQRLEELEMTESTARAAQDSLQGVNRDLGRALTSLVWHRSQLLDLEQDVGVIEQESTQLRAARDALQSEKATLKEEMSRIRQEKQSILRAFGITAITLLAALLVGAVVVFVRHKAEVLPTQSAIHPDLQALYDHYRRMSVVGRFALAGGTAVTFFLVGFVAFTIGFGSEGLLFLQGEAFWKTLAAVAAPIGFLLAAYNIIEQRRLEVTKFITQAE